MKTVVFNLYISVRLLSILSVFLMMCAAPVLAEDDDARELKRQTVLQGILGSKALLLVDGKRLMLSKGQASKSGVRVLRIGAEMVEITIDGEHRQLRLGDSHSVTGRYKERESVEVTIFRDQQGMYSTVGSINGLPVSFLVDTGATTIAMNKQHAKRLAIDFRVIGKEIFVGTASGVAKAFEVTLNKVSVGGITQQNVVAVVMDGNFPTEVLLGMTFLGKLEMQREGAALRLKKTF